MSRPVLLSFVAVMVAALLAPIPASAQYFGRNKVRYDDFDFRILETQHFDLYYYEGMETAAQDAGRMAERWYERLSSILDHEFDERKSIILYADDADFRQTNIVNVGEGTQGVTEGLRQRVILPMAGTYAETNHVLGHELIHQFQYDIAQRNGTFQQFIRMPLFVIEGMAEYYTVGREDALTSMWARDAILRDDFPTIQDLQANPRYNEYQYGQVFWAFIAGTYGDEAGVRMFKQAMTMPLDSALVNVTGLSPDSLSSKWIASLREHLVPHAEGRAVPRPEMTDDVRERIARYERRVADDRARGRDTRIPRPPGIAYPDSFPQITAERLLARERGSGNIAIAPQLSPDGRNIAFLSEKDLFGIDIFLANAENGEIIAKLEEVGTDPHFDAIRFIESAGTWSPSGNQFAYVVFAGGDNEIAILDVDRRDVVRRITVRGVGAIKDPAWSPDGTQIAFSGVAGGLTDLYTVDLASGEVRQLTSDRFTDLQANWHPDGRRLVFISDRGPGTSFERLTFSPVRLSILDTQTGEVEIVNPFPGRKHINPVWSRDGESLYFISDRGGFNDVYRLVPETGDLFQVTNLATGVAGIAEHSPALSIARQTGALAYSVFEAQRYSVYRMPEDEAQGTPVEPLLARVEADVLPPGDALGRSTVEGYLADSQSGLPEAEPFDTRGYRAKLSLDYVSQPQVGVGVGGGGLYGSGFGIAGGIQFLFSDQLSDNVLGVSVSANGSLQDVGGQALYINRGNRLTYGALLGQVPFLQVFVDCAPDNLGGCPTNDSPDGYFARYYYRTYFTQAQALSAYPLNQSQRFEAQGGYTRIGYDLEVDRVVSLREDANGERLPCNQFGTGEPCVFTGREPVEGFDPDALNLFQFGGAFVGDYSYFGFTSPIRGTRYRFGVEGTAGSLNFASVTADARTYRYVRPSIFPDRVPVTLAVRGLHFGRYGGDDATSGRLQPIYLGFGTLVRGYSFQSFTQQSFAEIDNRLFGNKVAVASVEARIPLLGIPQLGAINFPYLPTELTVFADAGMAWGTIQEFRFFDTNGTAIDGSIGTPFSEQRPIYSIGSSLRMNVLGAIILEPYVAVPFSRSDRSYVFGLNFAPGW
ncbi:MAG: BamA/TamA family outer membrane protein [Bacteroidota bacterium]